MPPVSQGPRSKQKQQAAFAHGAYIIEMKIENLKSQ